MTISKADLKRKKTAERVRRYRARQPAPPLDCEEGVRTAFQPSRPPVEIAGPGQLKCDVKGCLLRALRHFEDGDRHYCDGHADLWLARQTETTAQPSPDQSPTRPEPTGITHEELARRIAEAEKRGRLEGLWGRVLAGDGNGTFNRSERVMVYSEADGHYSPQERAAQKAAARAEQERLDPWRPRSERELMQSIMDAQLPEPPSPNDEGQEAL